ncbi:MAG: tyrosine-type recombinase/integrase [Opitutae bacterium]|nr:tyrosine-type recombinase/integrase [Opitutae bacterium]
MIEYVFRPSRKINGRRVKSRLYSGRYSIARGERPRTVALHTPDVAVARKRLRDLVVDAQREREGLVAPRVLRDAQSGSIIALVAEYARDLKGRDLDAKHVHDTLNRIQRVIRECGWLRLADMRADSFTRWRGGFVGSAKTRKEYQISVNAFANWLVRLGKLERSPLVHLDRIETRGKQVRPYRAFTEVELRALLGAVSNERRVAYLTLLYTGQRRSEVAALVVEDLDLGESPSVRIRIETTKDKDKRAVALHPMLTRELRVFVPQSAAPTEPVFANFPSYDALRADLHRAGIERRDSLGRVVHFHSFRKTWQTMGVRAGISQRVAQEVLGHSDPALTANVYTDIAAVGMHAEIEKLPWVGNNAQLHSQKASKTAVLGRFREILGELVTLAKAVGAEGLERVSDMESVAARAGIEPATK